MKREDLEQKISEMQSKFEAAIKDAVDVVSYCRDELNEKEENYKKCISEISTTRSQALKDYQNSLKNDKTKQEQKINTLVELYNTRSETEERLQNEVITLKEQIRLNEEKIQELESKQEETKSNETIGNNEDLIGAFNVAIDDDSKLNECLRSLKNNYSAKEQNIGLYGTEQELLNFLEKLNLKDPYIDEENKGNENSEVKDENTASQSTDINNNNAFDDEQENTGDTVDSNKDNTMDSRSTGLADQKTVSQIPEPGTIKERADIPNNTTEYQSSTKQEDDRRPAQTTDQQNAKISNDNMADESAEVHSAVKAESQSSSESSNIDGTTPSTHNPEGTKVSSDTQKKKDHKKETDDSKSVVQERGRKEEPTEQQDLYAPFRSKKVFTPEDFKKHIIADVNYNKHLRKVHQHEIRIFKNKKFNRDEVIDHVYKVISDEK